MTDRTVWRLILSAPADGAWNMAVDEAMLEAGVAGLIRPTLRLYAWQPPAVSLGFFQPLDNRIDLAEIAARGFGLVRRPSGGRAILHKDELTYSVVVPEELVENGRSVMGSYRTLSRGIEAGLGLLGLGVEMPDRRHAPRMKAAGLPTVCFAASAGGDMVAGGRKIVGSAQTRRLGVVLQHGTLPLTGDITRLVSYLRLPEAERELLRGKLAARATTLEAVLGRPIGFDEAARAMRAGFAAALRLELEESRLTPQEEAWAAELRARYLSSEWNEAR